MTPDKRGAEAVSLEEAKKITATFDGKVFTPPPRTINDITRILSQERPDDMDIFKQSLAIADSKPPATRDASKLAKFYFMRAKAAHGVGRAKQELADYRSAIQYGAKCHFRYQAYATFRLGLAEFCSGNASRSIELIEQAINMSDNMCLKSSWNAIVSHVYAEAGDLDEARNALNRAMHCRRVATQTYHQSLKILSRDLMDSQINRAQGHVLDLIGRPQEGEAHHRRAVASWESYKHAALADTGFDQKTTAEGYAARVHSLARNLLLQDRLIEAEVQERRALIMSLKSHGLFSACTGMKITGLNRVIFEQGRYEEAEALARANLEILQRTNTAGDSQTMAEAHSILADAILSQKRWHEALAEYDSIQEVLKNDAIAYKKLITQNVNLCLALIKGGRSDDALKLAGPAFERKKALLGEHHYDAAEIQGVLAMALAATGDKKGALREFAEAIKILLDCSSWSKGEEGSKTAQNFRLGLILDAYIQLLAKVHNTILEKEVGIDAAAEAFRLSDMARARTVTRTLASFSARAAAKDPALEDLARREQDALTQIWALNNFLSNILSMSSGQQSPNAVKNLRSRIYRLKSARSTLMKEIEACFPDYADLVNPKPVDIKEAQSYLRHGESLISTYVGEEGSYVWAIPHQGAVVFASIGLDEKSISQMVKMLRTSLSPTADTLGDIPDLDLDTANRLYEALLKPVKAGWKDAKNIIVIAHGTLGFIPFSVLPTKATKLGPEKKPLFSNYRAIPYLAKSHTVTMLPSVVSLRVLRNLPTATIARRPFKGFGNPYFRVAQALKKEAVIKGGADSATRGLPLKRRALHKVDKHQDSAFITILPPLPDTAVELREIALALRANPERDVYLGKAASEDTIKSMDLSDVKVLAFATHGLLPGDLNGLRQMALALSSPEVTGGKEDGLLTSGEILGLKLNADWVVLSACNTAAGEGAGADAFSGLGRAFFYAGTRALLVSNWPVETTSAKTLTTNLFQHQEGNSALSRSEALNRSMLDMIDKMGYMKEGRMVFSYAHPIFWAPFILVGDGE